MNEAPHLRVAIDAQVLPWRNGGVTHALVALVRALAQLPSGEEYLLLVRTDEEEAYWRPLLGPNQSLARIESRTPRPADPTGWRRFANRAPVQLRNWLRDPTSPERLGPHWPEVPISDGFYEQLGCDVLHIPWQNFVLTSLPTIYNPHDLQHLYFPQFFTPTELAWKETMYNMGCRCARTVAVGSAWAKQDFVRQYGLDPAKVQVIPEGAQISLAPATDLDVERAVRVRYALPERYVIYPAIMWPHKNHLGLLDALAVARDTYGHRVSLVCTGTKREPTWPQVAARIESLGLQSQVQCLGYVPEEDLKVIQRLAHCLVQPSLFEASSLPIFDAWLEGVPVACSNTTALPEQLGDAGLLFDPADTRQVAEAIHQLTTDQALRSDLIARGRLRLQRFNWTQSALGYRALYRRAAGLRLGEEDQHALDRTF